MEEQHLISVIIPVYNVEKYLRQCVESVLAQTYRKLEIILVDDGSPDNSGRLCDELQKEDVRIKVVHKENAGLGEARNTGMETATGDYIYFLDSDDYIAEDEVEKLYQAILRENVDIVITGFTSVDDHGNIKMVRKYKPENFHGEDVRNKMLPRLIGSAPDKKDSLEMAAAGSMYNLNVIRENNLRFVSERKMKNEDMNFNVDYLQHAKGGCVIDSIGQFYRNNPESISHRYQPDRFERDKIFYIGMKEKLIGLGYDEPVINRLRRFFFIHILIGVRQIKDPRAGFTFAQKVTMMKKLCGDELVQAVISEYPYQKLGIKQRTFVIMVKHKMALLLLLLAK